MTMLKKLFAAAICGIVIASVASHAEAAGPGGFARGFMSIERNVVAAVAPVGSACTLDLAASQMRSELDDYLAGFDQSLAVN